MTQGPSNKTTPDSFRAALASDSVKKAAEAIKAAAAEPSLSDVLKLAEALASSLGAAASATMLRAELLGYNEVEAEVPEERKAMGYASPFPVRALDLGLLDPEEIFLANREKFSQVTLTIGQPIEELQTALAQLKQGGVLALRVPAAEITSESADTDADAEIFIYILPREIQRIVESVRARALNVVMSAIVDAAAG